MAYPAERTRNLPTRNLPTLLTRSGSLSVDLGWPREPAANPWRVSAYMVDRPRQFSSVIWDHAAPLTAIPMRDLLELDDYFDRRDMPEVEADVNHRLGCLLPEPAWDEEIVGFLAECQTRREVGRGIGHRFDAWIEGGVSAKRDVAGGRSGYSMD